MINIDPEFSVELFIDFLKELDRNDQKRILFMIEAGQTIFDELEYDTGFGHYKDFKNSTDVMIRSRFYRNHYMFVSHISGGHLFDKPGDESRAKWNDFKKIFLQELKLSVSIFDDDYESFKKGLKLKQLRDCTKKEFSEKSGLSLYKITQIEDYGFMSKLKDINEYVIKGLK